LSEPPFVVENNAQLKVIADPQRQRILAAFARAPSTVKAVAAELGLAPTRLYRHVDMLVAAGFLKAVAEVQRRGAIERTFAATAKRIAIGPGAFAEGGGGVPEREALVRENLERILVRPRNPGELVVMQGQVRISQDGLERLQKEIAELLQRSYDPTGTTADVMVVLAAGATPARDEPSE
jgi:predicted transcriptional regulator